MTEFGVSPYLTARQFGELGSDLTIYPMGLFRLAMRAVDAGIDELKQHGTLEHQANEQNMLTRSELYDLLHYDPMQTPWKFPSPTRRE